MNIALVGYGKMGKAIEKIAVERGHTIVLKIRKENLEDMTTENLQRADVVIEFSGPHSAKENAIRCLQLGLPVVSGSTGWNQDLPEAQATATENNTAFLHASNFSVGVNLFFEINKQLANLMNQQTDYQVAIEEIHHTEKKDAPSGTAISLAEQVIAGISRLQQWALAPQHPGTASEKLPITALRQDAVPGTHTVSYSSAVDDITITHIAHNREGFAKGAVLAAEFIEKKQGIFTMKDVLGIGA